MKINIGICGDQFLNNFLLNLCFERTFNFEEEVFEFFNIWLIIPVKPWMGTTIEHKISVKTMYFGDA